MYFHLREKQIQMVLALMLFLHMNEHEKITCVLLAIPILMKRFKSLAYVAMMTSKTW